MRVMPSFIRSRCLSGILSVAGIAWLLAADAAHAQIRPLVIKDARIVRGPGDVVEGQSIRIKGSRIDAIAAGLETGFLTRTIDASGKTVTAGLIDVASNLGLSPGGDLSGSATHRVIDALDRYAKDPVIEALSQGVTTVFVTPPAGQGVTGMGAVLRVTPLGEITSRVLVEESALCASIGVTGAAGPVARLRAVADLEAKFRAAIDHRDAKEAYDEDLEEYEKKIKERAEKESKDDNKDDKKEKPEKSSAANEENGDKEKKEGQEKDEFAKPAEPARNPEAELLLRVLDGDVQLRVEAHRPEDILNLLDLAREFSIRLILVGASGGHLVAQQIADANVPVIVGPTLRPAIFEDSVYRYHDARNAARLAEAGATVYVSSGAIPGETRFLAFNAAQAVGHGLDAQTAFAGVTTQAARLLGVDDTIGRVARGMEADLVIWSADPLTDPAARVEKVLVAGTIVYDAKDHDPLRRTQ